MKMKAPLHPGVIVREILINGANLTVTEAAFYLDVNRTTLSRLLNGRIGISPDMAIRLAKLLPHTDELLWMNLQRDYDLCMAHKNSKKMKIRPLKKAA